MSNSTTSGPRAKRGADGSYTFPPRHGKPGLKMSADEVRRFNKASKDPKFIKLLADYMKEISDPKNKAEYEKYLDMVEARSNGRGGSAGAGYPGMELPRGTKLLRPNPSFCVKMKVQDAKKAGVGSTATVDKVFINVCYNDLIEQAGPDRRSGRNEARVAWKVPHALSPRRQVKDNKGKMQPCFDVVYNPETIKLGKRNPQVQQLLVETAVDAVCTQLKLVSTQKLAHYAFVDLYPTISSSMRKALPYVYRIVRGREFTGDSKPPMLTWRVKETPNDENQHPNGKESKEPAPVESKEPAHTALKSSAMESADKSRVGLSNEHITVESEVPQSEGNADNREQETNVRVPEYTITEKVKRTLQSYEIPLSHPDYQPGNQKNIPTSLLVKIQLPDVVSFQKMAAAASLKVFPEKICFDARGDVYAPLEVPLPYLVDDARCKARFLSAKRTLAISCPVIDVLPKHQSVALAGPSQQTDRSAADAGEGSTEEKQPNESQQEVVGAESSQEPPVTSVASEVASEQGAAESAATDPAPKQDEASDTADKDESSQLKGPDSPVAKSETKKRVGGGGDNVEKKDSLQPKGASPKRVRFKEVSPEDTVSFDPNSAAIRVSPMFRASKQRKAVTKSPRRSGQSPSTGLGGRGSALPELSLGPTASAPPPEVDDESRCKIDYRFNRKAGAYIVVLRPHGKGTVVSNSVSITFGHQEVEVAFRAAGVKPGGKPGGKNRRKQHSSVKSSKRGDYAFKLHLYGRIYPKRSHTCVNKKNIVLTLSVSPDDDLGRLAALTEWKDLERDLWWVDDGKDKSAEGDEWDDEDEVPVHPPGAKRLTPLKSSLKTPSREDDVDDTSKKLCITMEPPAANARSSTESKDTPRPEVSEGEGMGGGLHEPVPQVEEQDMGELAQEEIVDDVLDMF